jgi:probable rRNA maturation factor
MTTTMEPAAAHQDDGGPSSSADSDVPPEHGRPARWNVDADLSVAVMPGVQRSLDADAEWLSERLAAAVREIRRPVQRVSVLIVDDERMTALHHRHLGAACTTDVLTFPASEGGEAIDTDIAVCVDAAARQAEQRGHPLAREILLYAIHGVLHCAGFDDHDESDARAMHAEEDRILLAIGVGPTFADGPPYQTGHDGPAAQNEGGQT